MATDPRDPELTWSDAGEPRSGRFGDVYFSADDGLAESRAVFLDGCGLPDAWAGRSGFTVAELGFGTGLNVAALLELWTRTRPPGGRLNLFTIEAFPLMRDQAARALAAWPGLTPVTRVLLDRWPAPTPGFHRIDLPEFAAVLDLAVGDVAWALDQWSGSANAWFLDGFAPATNPAMWSEAVLDAIAARSAPDARLATFTVAGSVRRGLSARGFAVEKRPGHGRKRERLEARLTDPPRPTSPPASVAVIGAGIAGAAVTRALLAQGVRPLLFEGHRPGAGASGFPAALVTPRFDLGDATVAALFAQALSRAGTLYRATPGTILAEGVRQLAKSPAEAARFARLAQQPLWPDGALIADAEGLTMRDALTVAPQAILSAWQAGAEARAAPVDRLKRDGAGWRLLDPDGADLAEVEAVVVCAGAAAADLVADLIVSPVRGQADWIVGPSPPAMAWGGYVAPTVDGFLFGATHDRGEVDTAVRMQDTRRNLQTLADRLPDLAQAVDPGTCRAHAAVRATTRDRLPFAGAVDGRPGLFVLGGLGSRGFCLAPLLAEHVCAELVGRPSPLPRSIADRVAPDRASVASGSASSDVGVAIS